ncbi:phage holin family protein [Clostridium tertium]|uniref:Membrane protein of uncharacterized function n=1 Tax=Clostridium tertium TaxID=1559 RepID=A0A6N3AN11_9CLOT
MVDSDKSNSGSSMLRLLGRLVLVAIVLGLTSFFTPGFSIRGIWSYLIAAVVITVLDYFIELFMKVDASPFGKGLKGFAVAAIIIYLTQFFVPNMNVSIIGAILSAVVIGIIDAVVPVRVM